MGLMGLGLFGLRVRGPKPSLGFLILSWIIGGVQGP